jgi:vacuolar-type H+-ATPase subunit I/STV1
MSMALVLAARLALAAEPADLDALQKQMQELRARHAACFNKLREIEDKINASPAVEPLRKARKETHDAYQAKLKADPALAAANKAHDEAWHDFTELVRQKLAESNEAKAILKQLEWLDDAEADIAFRRDLAEFELLNRRSPINRAVEKDPQIKALAKAVEDAERECMRDRSEANIAVRRKAEAALAEAKKAKLQAMPEAKRLSEQIQEAEKEIEKLRKERQETDQRLYEFRNKLEKGDDPALKAADAKVQAARKLVTQATNSPELRAARDASDQASVAATAKTRELMAADPEAAALTKERDALDKEMAQLFRKIREAKKR